MSGTAPGLICPIGNKVVYAVPGVPYEMAEMFERAILPDLRARMAEAGEEGVIASRVLRTWGASESGLAEALQDRIDALDAPGDVTLAFLASGIEGIKVRITARARTLDDVTALLDKEEAEVRRAIDERLGDIVFGVDDESMEVAVAHRLIARGLSFGVAESLTGGLIASRLVNVPGASAWFRGGVVAYDSQVKYDVLGVPAGPVVTESAAAAMAEGAATGDEGRRRPRHHRRGRARGAGGRGAGHRLRRPRPSPVGRLRPASCGCPATGSGCGSTGQFRPSTCCDAPSTPTPPEPPRSQQAHSRVTLDEEPRARPCSGGR